MLRICTVHHETNKFLDIQEKYFENFTKESYKLYRGYSDFEPLTAGQNSVNINLNGMTNQHALRLNHMFGIISLDCDDSDILVFADSDAYPIMDNWLDYVKEKLIQYPVVAVLRQENMAALTNCSREEHPHPCFFVTTVGFWRSNNLNFDYQVNTGYNILTFLQSRGLDFYKLLRSNTVDIHPLMFGVYDDIIYHHGAGNRPPYDGVDICLRKRLGHGPELDLHYPQILLFNQKLSELVYDEMLDDDNFIRNYLLGIR